jgi:aconitate hydratase
MRRTGRSEELISTVEAYCKAQGLWFNANDPVPEFTDYLSLDLGTVEPSLAGPIRPQDRIPLSQMQSEFQKALRAPIKERGYNLDEAGLQRTGVVKNGHVTEITHGAVVMAAITSCTNTSNPSVMIGAGILAKNAVEKGLTVPPYVKTSLAPGSKVVTDYYDQAGLTPYLDKLGFNLVGYGCTTCIGNSGPLPEEVSAAVKEGDLVVSVVASGNRNFSGRMHPEIRANYLASPPLVVAYALAGTTDIDLYHDPIGTDKAGDPVYLRDIWPTKAEIEEAVRTSLTTEMFETQYGKIYTANETWNEIPTSGGEVYDWNPDSTYIQEPPFFIGMSEEVKPIGNISGAKVLVKAGDSTTTDHISPAGAIARGGPAALYLDERDVSPLMYNSFGSRRGNDRIMTRGTFANVRLRNQMAPGTEGGYTTYLPTGEVMTIFDASLKYKEDGTDLMIIAGKDYGMGSSRDWAAKGTLLLGAKMVIAESYERIHRSNLVGMGVLPLEFKAGETLETLGLTGKESFSTVNLDDNIKPLQDITIRATKEDGTSVEFQTTCRIDTPVEVDYYRNGGILHTVLRNFLKE